MNKYEILADIEFTVLADTYDKALEIADEKLSVIPAYLKVTGVAIREEAL